MLLRAHIDIEQGIMRREGWPWYASRNGRTDRRRLGVTLCMQKDGRRVEMILWHSRTENVESAVDSHTHCLSSSLDFEWTATWSATR